MKKNKRHLYKRLPKYALGTMKPIDLGYQPGRGIGSTKFQTEQNVSLEPETQAIRKSALPNALGYVAQQTPYVTESLKAWNNAHQIAQSTASTVAGAAATGINRAAAGLSSYGIQGLSKAPAGTQVVMGNGGPVSVKPDAPGVSNLGKVTNVAGKVMAGVGSAIGLYTMGNQIAGFGDHRSASDMMANVGRAQNTTEYGNQYTTYNGVNAGQELAYEKANARSKQLGFGMNALGTGASIGSFFGPVGTAIGAAAGLLLGGLGSLFGWGDNSEEIERLTRLTNDNIAMYNRQGESVARSKDVAAEFNDRQGVATAAGGKNAYGPMNAKKGDNINTPKMLFDVNAENNMSVGIPTSKLMPGETVFDKESLNWAVVPGKGNKDNVYSSVRPGDSNVVLTKKEGLSKIGAAVLKSNAPEDLKRWQLNELEKKQAALQESENNQSNMKKYKNGKLPGFWRGTDYLMSAIPHLAAMGASWNQYNRAKHADTHAPSTYVNNAAGAQALNELAQLRFDPTQYLTDAMRAYNQANFQANRMAGLGAGGQAILRNANYQNYLDSLGKIRIAQQDSDNKYHAAHANALAEYGAREQEALINDNIRRFQWQQQQNAAKEGWMAQYEKNGLTALADLASDVMGVRQFNRSEDYQNRMLDLYDRQVANDEYKVYADYLNRQNNKPTANYTYPSLLQQAAYATVGRTPQEAIFSSIPRLDPRSIKIRGFKG